MTCVACTCAGGQCGLPCGSAFRWSRCVRGTLNRVPHFPEGGQRGGGPAPRQSSPPQCTAATERVMGGVRGHSHGAGSSAEIMPPSPSPPTSPPPLGRCTGLFTAEMPPLRHRVCWIPRARPARVPQGSSERLGTTRGVGGVGVGGGPTPPPHPPWTHPSNIGPNFPPGLRPMKNFRCACGANWFRPKNFSAPLAPLNSQHQPGGGGGGPTTRPP